LGLFWPWLKIISVQVLSNNDLPITYFSVQQVARFLNHRVLNRVHNEKKIDNHKIISLLFQTVGHIKVFFYVPINLFYMMGIVIDLCRKSGKIAHLPDEAWVPCMHSPGL